MGILDRLTFCDFVTFCVFHPIDDVKLAELSKNINVCESLSSHCRQQWNLRFAAFTGDRRSFAITHSLIEHLKYQAMQIDFYSTSMFDCH